MYYSIWIDILTGKDTTVPEEILEVFQELKADERVHFVELGIIFEDWDIFGLIEVDEPGVLVEFMVEKVCMVDGVEEILVGNLHGVTEEIAPIAGDDVEGSYYLIYLDAEPAYYKEIYNTLHEAADDDIRFFGYCFEHYDRDLVVGLLADDIEEATQRILCRLRTMEGMRDTFTYIVNNTIQL